MQFTRRHGGLKGFGYDDTGGGDKRGRVRRADGGSEWRLAMRKAMQFMLAAGLMLTGVGLALVAYVAYELEVLYPSRWRNVWNFTLPLWLIVIAFVALGAIMLVVACRRRPPGHCTQCGYDLTGNESGVCPECGRPIPPES